MNNKLRNMSKYQLLDIISSRDNEIEDLHSENKRTVKLLEEVRKSNIDLEQQNKVLNDNLRIADNDCHDFRLYHQMYKINASNSYRKVLILLTCSVIVNFALLLIAVILWK